MNHPHNRAANAEAQMPEALAMLHSPARSALR